MKAKIAMIFLVLFVVNQGYGIGLPHGFNKKKKQETVEFSKKENKLEKKIFLMGTTVSFIIGKLVTYSR
ncbi:MAG: hypothetical protein V4683_00670 [Bacteroidota bacterium]